MVISYSVQNSMQHPVFILSTPEAFGEKVYVFKVDMTCEGCVKAISNVLSKYKDEGIPKFVVNLETKTVETESTLTVEEVTEILKKTGKTVSFLQQK